MIAKTEKGHGVSFLANQEGWHGKALSQEEAERAIAELGGPRDVSVTPRKPEAGVAPQADAPNVTLPAYAEAIATRKAFGETLAALAVRGEVVAIDGEVANSTYTEDLQKVAPDRFVEGYIAEQNMLGMAVGMQVLGKVVFPATFAAFFTRAYDFIRMAAISRANLRLSGSARRGVDRRGRSVADGARGPGDDARRPRFDGALPVRRQLDRAARWARWPTCRGSRSSARPGRRHRPSTAAARPSRSAARRPCGPRSRRG